MKNLFLIAVLGALLFQSKLPADELAPTPASTFKSLAIAPASTSLAGGKANLTVRPLAREGASCKGEYQLKVSPYFFKSETGKIALTISDASFVALSQTKPVKFTGTATSNKNGKVRPISGVATPTAPDRGSVTFSILTDNGALIFTSAFTFSGKAD